MVDFQSFRPERRVNLLDDPALPERLGSARHDKSSAKGNCSQGCRSLTKAGGLEERSRSVNEILLYEIRAKCLCNV